MAGDQDVVGVRLRHARRDRPDAGLGDQLDADPSPGVGHLQVVDQLGQVLDAVDVVVGRRRDQGDARIVKRNEAMMLLFFIPELAALAGLGALGHLDLELVGHRQVLGGDAEQAEATCLILLWPRSPLGSGT